MFLKNLKMQIDESVIRDISFHKGINLIVDETESAIKTDTGNSVGKTTVLRLIDYCLDGGGKNIFTDSEFKNTNIKVESFLLENNVLITLTLIDDITAPNSKEVVISRNFLKHKNKIQMINGEKKTNNEFSKELKEIIFNTDSEKPTFKQLKSKNIRDEENKLVQTIRVLNSFTTNAEYEALHLFWFGIDVDLSKDKLIREKNLEDKLQFRLRRESNLSQINQSLIIVNKEIDRLDTQKNNFNLNENFEIDLHQLNSVKSEINVISNHLSHNEMRIELIEESEADLKNNSADINLSQIRALYDKAQALLPNVQKTFEQTVEFHNEMISQKVIFITEELPSLKQGQKVDQKKISELLKQEKKLSEALGRSDALNELEQIVSELNAFHEKKGSLEEQQRLWGKTLERMKEIEAQLASINDEIDQKDDLIQSRIAEFNSYFSNISSRLDGEHSLLSADMVDGIYTFAIGNIDGNPGTGGKKSQMASFDLSYVKFADENKIPCLHFILQDQIENVHSNQITNLLTEIVDEVNCQYVLPVLRDKLPDSVDIDGLEVLSLSENDKLFRI